MALHLLSKRNVLAAPSYTVVYNFENVVRDTCGARILAPRAASVAEFVHAHRFPEAAKNFLDRALAKSNRDLETIHVAPDGSNDSPSVLLVVAVSGADLQLLNSVAEWRARFDLVVAFVYDAWLLDAFPELTARIDHLFVPMRDLMDPLRAKFEVPVSYWPHSANVLEHGSSNIERSIDVASYGRIPSEYHTNLFEETARTGSEFFYYRQVPETPRLHPEQPYTTDRFDFQHRVLLDQILAHSKITLAFDFSYTVRGAVELPNYERHPSYAYRKPVLTPRWFEGLASGTVLVGRRPPAPESDELLDWEDATIELPDDVNAGVEAIMELLSGRDRLHAIHRRNYWNSLRRHDHRWRIKALFERLDLPLPGDLRVQLSQIEERLEHANDGS